MNLQKNEEGSLYQEIEKLDKEINRLLQEKNKVQEKIKELLLQEDIEHGKVYAKEINDLKLEKLKLEVEIDICKKKKNRLMWSSG